MIKVKIRRRGLEAGCLGPEEALGGGSGEKMGSYHNCTLRVSRLREEASRVDGSVLCGVP